LETKHNKLTYGKKDREKVPDGLKKNVFDVYRS